MDLGAKVKLGVNNFINIINHLKQKGENNLIMNLIPYICYEDFFQIESSSKISIRDMMLLISVCINHEQKNKVTDVKNDYLVQLYLQFTVGKGKKYLSYILNKTPGYTIIEWLNMLNNYLKKYHRMHKKQISRLKHNKVEKKQITKYKKKYGMNFEHEYGSILYDLLKMTILVLFERKNISKFEKDYDFQDELLAALQNTDGGYEWEKYINILKKEINKRNLKI